MNNLIDIPFMVPRARHLAAVETIQTRDQQKYIKRLQEHLLAPSSKVSEVS